MSESRDWYTASVVIGGNVPCHCPDKNVFVAILASGYSEGEHVLLNVTQRTIVGRVPYTETDSDRFLRYLRWDRENIEL